MIITKPTTTIEGNLGGITAAMTMRAEDMAHIMGVLTDLYSNKPLAILREYSTNARDSHVAAGVDRPIEVELPTGLRNKLVIRDFGLGMSVEDLTETYGMFGRSTKRESNEFNGCLGLGSKSALSYGSTFTVSSVKNGVRSEVVITRDASGVGQLTVVDTRATDETNGTTVTIPVDPNDDFSQIAEDFFMVWDKGTVLVNGAEPMHISEAGYTKVGEFYFKPTQRNWYGRKGHLNVVMGGVTYRHEMSPMANLVIDADVYAFVDTGAVEFVPSREALQVTPAVQATIDDIWQRAEQAYIEHFNEKIAIASSLTEAAKLFITASSTLAHNTALTWRGIKLKNKIDYDGRVFYLSGYQSGTTERKDSANLGSIYNDFNNTAVLINRDSKSSLSAAERRRLQDYSTAKGLTYASVLFLGDNNHELLAEAPTIDWNDVVASTAQPRVSSGARVGMYDINTWNGYLVTRQETVPSTGLVLYVMKEDIKAEYAPIRLKRLLPLLPEGTSIVELGRNRLDKFRRENPKVLHVQEYAKNKLNELVSTITDDEVTAWCSHYQRGIIGLLAGKTEDNYIDLLHGIMDDVVEKFNKAHSLANAANVHVGRLEGENYMSKYPLANGHHMDHTIQYINLIHRNGK